MIERRKMTRATYQALKRYILLEREKKKQGEYARVILNVHTVLNFYSVPQCERRNTRIASTVLALAILPVCLPSVRLSDAGIVSKRRHAARCSLHCRIAKCV